MGVLQELANLILNPILGWMLDIPPVATIVIIAAIVAIVSVFFQKRFTNQERLKQLKKNMKKYQAEMKEVKNDPEKSMKIQKKMMPEQMEMMKESFKPALWTMLPFLLLFIWLSGHFAYLPLEPGTEFTITATVDKEVEQLLLVPVPELNVGEQLITIEDGEAEWTASGDGGFYTLQFFISENATGNPDASKNIIITNDKEYEAPIEQFRGPVKRVTVSNPPLKPLGDFLIFGWRPSWLALYIAFSLIFSMGLRKAMGVV